MCTLRYMPDIRLHLSDETQARLDEERGSVPRVRWIRDLIEDRLGSPPVRVPEPSPSKPVPDTPASVEAKMKQARKVIDQVVGNGETVNPRDCVHPKDHHKVLSWGTLCTLCNGRVTR